MSINFCSNDLVSFITASTTSFEGHEVSNLVSKKEIRTNKGFIADHYVKPPVSITLKFVCTIDISHILIKTFVGSQRSVKFEVCTKGCFGKGKVGSTLDLVNVDYVAFHKFGDNDFPFSWKQSPTKVSVPFDCPYKLKNVDQVILTIIRTSNSSVPCLGQLEIWASPSKSVSPKTVHNVYKKWALFLESPTCAAESTQEPLKTSVEVPNAIPVNDSMPEEFIDPITCEIMLCPMILPCGKIVDQSTLTKFYAAEEEWGRGKSDPYSGLLFSDTRKPFLDSVLKAKIDKYLVANSNVDYIMKLPRIIGKKPSSSIPGFPKVEPQPSSSNKNNYSICVSSKSETTESPSDGHATSSTLRRTKRSLDELISDSLSGLPSYLEAKVSKISKEECAICLKDELLFKLPCSHLICRHCLLKMSSENCLKCTVCFQFYNRSEPVRYHNT